jgi:hypothetical protein
MGVSRPVRRAPATALRSFAVYTRARRADFSVRRAPKNAKRGPRPQRGQSNSSTPARSWCRSRPIRVRRRRQGSRRAGHCSLPRPRRIGSERSPCAIGCPPGPSSCWPGGGYIEPRYHPDRR